MVFENFKDLAHIAETELFTALVGDILDKMGYYHQFLPQELKPLREDMVIFGKAMPVVEADFFDEQMLKSHNPLINKPFYVP
ncbi:hypothetical protein [Coprobacter fastidiosus]